MRCAAGGLTCIFCAKKVSFWAADVSSCDLEYSLLPLKASFDSDPVDEAAYARCSSMSACSAQRMTQHAQIYVAIRIAAPAIPEWLTMTAPQLTILIHCDSCRLPYV